MTLGNVPPRSTINHVLHGTIGGAVFSRQVRHAGSTARKSAADLHNTACGEFGRSCGLPSALSTLALHIVHVVLLGAEKQVRRIAAWAIVATVKNANTWRYWSIGYSPSEPRPYDIPPNPTSDSESECSVTIRPLDRAAPHVGPARISTTGLVNLGPEPLNIFRCGCKITVHFWSLLAGSGVPCRGLFRAALRRFASSNYSKFPDISGVLEGVSP